MRIYQIDTARQKFGYTIFLFFILVLYKLQLQNYYLLANAKYIRKNHEQVHTLHGVWVKVNAILLELTS